MKYTISKDRSKLTISADRAERKLLREGWDNPGKTNIESDKALYDFFEHLLCNSELEWICAVETGDLTSAPMLGTKDEGGKVLERWAFLAYALRSPLEDLRDTGKAVFVGGGL